MKLTEKYLGRRFDSAQVHQKHTESVNIFKKTQGTVLKDSAIYYQYASDGPDQVSTG